MLQSLDGEQRQSVCLFHEGMQIHGIWGRHASVYQEQFSNLSCIGFYRCYEIGPRLIVGAESNLLKPKSFIGIMNRWPLSLPLFYLSRSLWDHNLMTARKPLQNIYKLGCTNVQNEFVALDWILLHQYKVTLLMKPIISYHFHWFTYALLTPCDCMHPFICLILTLSVPDCGRWDISHPVHMSSNDTCMLNT